VHHIPVQENQARMQFMDGSLCSRAQLLEGHLRSHPASPIAVRTSIVCGDGFEGAVVKILTESKPTDSQIY
jgi:hypothetical protein